MRRKKGDIVDEDAGIDALLSLASVAHDSVGGGEIGGRHAPVSLRRYEWGIYAESVLLF